MGREVRRVPADWQHPKHWTECMRGPEERYKPLFPGEDYQQRADEWDEECAKWKTGWRPDHCESAEQKAMCYEQWAGQRPHRDDYMPNWPAEQRLAKMLLDPRATREDCDLVRHAIERLRRELGGKA